MHNTTNFFKGKRGGKRLGSGQKQKYGEPTVTISFRCPESKEEEIRIKIITWLMEFRSQEKESDQQ